MIPKDHGLVPFWVERQEQEKIERSLPWRCDPGGTMWQRDPSPRWRVREEWTNATAAKRETVMKYKLVTGPGSASPGVNVHPQTSTSHDDDDTLSYVTAVQEL